MNWEYSFEYYADGVIKKTNECSNDDFILSIDGSEDHLSVSVLPKRKIEFKKFELTADYKVDREARIFTNGYQSWTVSREYAPNEAMDEFNPRFLGVKKSTFNPLGIWGAGDLLWHDYPEKKGVFYGYSYSYVRNGNNLTLFGSLSERAGYTVFTFNTNENTLTVSKDLEGVCFDSEKRVLDLAIISGEYNFVFDKYFSLINIPKPRVDRKCGYTTWYNYYTKVTQDIVKRDLKAISRLDTKIDIFQIDDGYERTVGDWLETDSKKFPDGMETVADSIHKNSMLAGLWLAPFAVTPKSNVFKEHKDWLVTDENGKYHYSSQNWGGFYALDIYNKEVRAHLKNVFDTVLNVWGYDMVKLDFLYACCQRPIHNKSRGEIMCDAMDLIREWCGDKIILGCGVPLAPAFGKVDFCRIGADVALSWNKKPFSREDVSTKNTLTNTIYRRHLDGRAWLNDPDVFLLRDNNIKMPMSQRKIVAEVNSMLGNLLFVSDDVSTYTDEQMRIFTKIISCDKAEIISAEIADNVACIKTKNKEFKFNMSEGRLL
ncbi:MAG: alpha-galactosidase [Eubacterium sp.]|nr:alpha-galactosidase [Eubacterium sp.]